MAEPVDARRKWNLVRMSLADASREEREEYMEWVYRAAIEERQPHESDWLDLYEEWRNITDKSSPYRNKVRSTYAYTAVMSQLAVLEPIFFTSDPVCEIHSQWEENYPTNAAHEKVLTKQVQSARSQFRDVWSRSLVEAAVFGACYPTVSWEHRIKKIGPLPTMGSAEGSTGQNYRDVLVYRGPRINYNSLWDTFIHPDTLRGMTLRDMTGHELLRYSQGPMPYFDPVRVERALKVAKSQIAEGAKSNRDEFNFAFGDSHQVERDQLAQLVGTESGLRHVWQDMDPSLRKSVMWFPFPVMFYDDGEYSGAYLINRDGRFYELRFFQGASVDGESNRLLIGPWASPGELYPTSLLQIGLGLLQARSRFLQLSIDGAELTVHPTWMVSDTYDRMNGALLTGPGAVNVVPIMGGRLEEHVARLDMPQSWTQAVGARQAIIDPELDDLFAQDQHTKGQFPSGRHSAAAANLVGAANSARVELVADRIDAGFARPLLRKMDVMNYAYLTQKDYENYLGPIGARDVKPTNIEDVLARNDYIFKGSIIQSSRQTQLARYPSMVEAYLKALPYLQLPHVQEVYKRWFRDNGWEAITRFFPVADGTIPTMFQQLESGGGGTFTGLSKNPTDALGAMQSGGGDPQAAFEERALGGATAPRPPSNDFGKLLKGAGASSESQLSALI